jgi:hypothetical protein
MKIPAAILSLSLLGQVAAAAPNEPVVNRLAQQAAASKETRSYAHVEGSRVTKQDGEIRINRGRVVDVYLVRGERAVYHSTTERTDGGKLRVWRASASGAPEELGAFHTPAW